MTTEVIIKVLLLQFYLSLFGYASSNLIKLKHDNLDSSIDCSSQLDIKYCDLKCQLHLLSWKAEQVKKSNQRKLKNHIHHISSTSDIAIDSIDLLHTPHTFKHRGYFQLFSSSNSWLNNCRSRTNLTTFKGDMND